MPRVISRSAIIALMSLTAFGNSGITDAARVTTDRMKTQLRPTPTPRLPRVESQAKYVSGRYGRTQQSECRTWHRIKQSSTY